VKRLFWDSLFPHKFHSVGDHLATTTVQKLLNDYLGDYHAKRISRQAIDLFLKEKLAPRLSKRLSVL
jgi:hypothetical protein